MAISKIEKEGEVPKDEGPFMSYLFIFGGLPNLPGVIDTFNFRFSTSTIRANCSPTNLYVNTAVIFPIKF